MENLSNRALIARLFSSAEQQLEDVKFDKLNWEKWYEAVQELTGPEKMVYVLVKLNQAVTNGGFVEFYRNSYGVFAPEIIHVLTEIKAMETAEIVSGTLPVVNPEGLLDDAYKAFVFRIPLTDHQKMQLYSSDIRYDQLDGKENLEDLLGDYLQKLVV